MKTAKEIAAICKTCKECETHYKGLVESGIEKDAAKAIIKAAKAIINNRKETAKNQRIMVKGWFNDYESIGKSLLIGLLKEKEFSALKEQVKAYNCDIEGLVSDWITKADEYGKPIRTTKGVTKYREFTASNIRVILRECLENMIKVNNLQVVKFVRVEALTVTITE